MAAWVQCRCQKTTRITPLGAGCWVQRIYTKVIRISPSHMFVLFTPQHVVHLKLYNMRNTIREKEKITIARGCAPTPSLIAFYHIRYSFVSLSRVQSQVCPWATPKNLRLHRMNKYIFSFYHFHRTKNVPHKIGPWIGAK